MNNPQFHLALGLPTFAIITSLIISLLQVSGIREDGRRKVLAGETTLEEVLRVTRED